jgi:6-phosphogluconolactonase (cycloisomerase 2 family)
MTRPRTIAILTTAALLMLIVPALAQAQTTTSDRASTAGASHSAELSAAFTMTNNATANAVVAYRIGTGGALIPAETYATHGKGTGVSLADQGALALTSDHHWLLVVDAGSNQVSVFRVNHPSVARDLLTFWGRVGSGGVMPVSIAIHGPWVYVLNDGNATTAGDVAGFHLTSTGLLLSLPGSHRALSATTPTGAAQIAFSPSGNLLAVTEKATSLIDTYTVGAHGYAHGPITTASNGSTPYGFAFSPSGRLVVSDAGPGALSSYRVSSNGVVHLVSGSVLDSQSAPCWVVIAEDGQYAYTSNAHSASISTYRIARDGALTLQASVGATTGTGPTDMAATTSDGRYLLVYDSGAGEIDEFSLGSGGTLAEVASVYGLASTAEGLVAF